MSLLFQRMFTSLLNPFSRAMNRVGDRTRGVVLTISFFMMFLMHLFINSFTVKPRLLYECIYICVFFAIVILFSLKGELKPLKTKKLLTIPWFVTTLLILLSGIIVSYQFLPFGVFLLIGLPCFYFVWGNRGDFGVLYNSIALGALHVMTLVVILSLLFAPLSFGARYMGIFTNLNGFAFFCCAVTPFAIYGFVKWRGFKKWYSLFILATTVVFVVFSGSRTGIISLVACGAAWLLFSIVSSSGFKGFVKSVVVPTFVMLLALVVMFFSYGWALTQVNQYIGIEIVEVVNAVQHNCFNKSDYDNYFNERGKGTEDSNIFYYLSNMSDRLDTGGKEADTYSSGRVVIWETYLKELNLTGHSAEYRFDIPGRGLSATAHNNFLQVAYDSGIPSGVAYTICCVASGLLALLMAIKNRKNGIDWALPLIAVCGFVPVALLATAYIPFENVSALVYYVVLGALFFAKKTEAEPTVQ